MYSPAEAATPKEQWEGQPPPFRFASYRKPSRRVGVVGGRRSSSSRGVGRAYLHSAAEGLGGGGEDDDEEEVSERERERKKGKRREREFITMSTTLKCQHIFGICLICVKHDVLIVAEIVTECAGHQRMVWCWCFSVWDVLQLTPP